MIKFKILGCKISLSFPLVCALSIVFVLDKTSLGAISCVCAVCHELGHIIAMKMLNTTTNNIRLSLFDANINDNYKHRRTLPSELFVILSGVAVNLTLCLVSFVVYKNTNINEFLSFSTANMFLAVFNLLPVESLDGGNAIYVILIKFVEEQTAETILQIISFVILLPLATIGFIILIKSQYNFTLLFTSCYLMSIIVLKKSKVLWRTK